MNRFLVILFLFSTGCNPSTTSSAIPFLWDEEPEPSSSQIMVISTVANNELRRAMTIHLESLGFVVESVSDEAIITEPSRLEGELVRLNIAIDNNVAIISGDKGIPQEEDEIKWEPIIRGEGEGYGTAEWEIMDVLANSVSNTSILYD